MRVLLGVANTCFFIFFCNASTANAFIGSAGVISSSIGSTGEISSSSPKEFADDFFEGPEKTLMLKFSSSHVVNGSLRSLPDEAWRHVMQQMGIAILSKVESVPWNVSSKMGRAMDTGCTAYLLSESSLFVYNDRVVFKTCGLSSPLRGVRLFLDVARGRAGPPEEGLEQVMYSHPAFMRQKEQAAPHRAWDDEVAFLKALFPKGVERRLGTRQHGTDLFAANYVVDTSQKASTWVAAEIYITELEQPTALTTFAKESKASQTDWWRETDPDRIDEFYFDPSGYSANALHSSNAYATMHASPQPSVGYISHATNAMMSPNELKEMIDRTLRLAPGRHIGLFLFAFSPSNITTLPANSSFAIDGYVSKATWALEGPGFQASLLSLTLQSPLTCT